MSHTQSTSLNRRHFIQASGAALGAASLSTLTGCVSPQMASSASSVSIGRGDVILFQGDSITDASRKKDAESASVPNQQPGMGNGYAWLAGSELLVSRPELGLKIYNRGISGNKVFQLADRWQADCLELKPDVLSILIGVNDIWHSLKGTYDGTVQKYETDYLALIERTKLALPGVKLILCEPFVLRCGAVTDSWFPGFENYRAAARRVAERNRAVFVPFQTMFDEAIKYAPPEHWAADGVHPSPAGAALMASAWLRAVRSADV